MDRDEGLYSSQATAVIDLPVEVDVMLHPSDSSLDTRDALDAPVSAIDDASPRAAADGAPIAADVVEFVSPAPETDAPKLTLKAAPEPTPEQIVEALLLATDAPLTAARLAELADVSGAREVERLIRLLNERYEAAGLSFRVEEIARGYQLLTQPVFHPWLARLDKHRAQSRLSPAAMEALAIVAYKQPIIRADVEAIRGVACGEVLNRLREMGLVKIVGRAEIVGRPILYGTTRKFLDVFGLPDLDGLPPMEAFSLRRAGSSTSGDAPTGDGGAFASPSLAASVDRPEPPHLAAAGA